MITLSNAIPVKTVLGGTSTVNYDKMVLDQIRYITTGGKVITANVRVTSTADPNMQEINGSLKIDVASSLLTIEVAQLDFYRKVTLTGPQVASITALITNAQDALESGLISVGVAAGTQQTGTLL